MGRPKGAKNRLYPGHPDYDVVKNKPGRKPGGTLLSRTMPKLKDDEILSAKVKILESLSSGAAVTLSAAARLAGLDPVRVYFWGQSDPDFQEMTHLAREVRADMLEKKLEESGNFIPWMFLLKGDRPKYRDNYRAPIEDSKTKEIMERLLELAKSGSKKSEPEPDS